MTLEVGKEDLARGAALSVLQDFSTSDDPQLATLERVLIILKSYGRLKTGIKLSPRDEIRFGRATALLNSSNSKKHFVIRKDFEALREKLRNVDIKTEGQRWILAKILQSDALELTAADTVRDLYTANGSSIESLTQLEVLFSTSLSDYFLDHKLTKFDLNVDGTFPLWDRMSIRLSPAKELSMESLYEPSSHVPIGSISAAVLPVGLYGLNPITFRHLTFSWMPEDMRRSLGTQLKIPVGFVVVRDLCVTCLQLGELPALPLPVGTWSDILVNRMKELVGINSRMAVVGVVYEVVDINWNN